MKYKGRELAPINLIIRRLIAYPLMIEGVNDDK